jgi:serine/threonine protein kinase
VKQQVSSTRDFIGPYRLIRMIRSGQSCQIWEARREGDADRVALKVLQEQQKKKKDQIALLKREAEVGQQLDHRYLIKVFEFNNSHGMPFVAMELFNEKNLKQMMREEKEIIAYYAPSIIRRCAKALAYLHEQGWIHCDVKPDNFLVSRKGRIKLLDFAIAQRWQKKGGLLSFLNSGAKNISGTRSYMSPEQIRGKVVDPRSDIYSLGCMIYEMLAGKLPYSGVSGDDLLSKHLRAQIPNVVATNKSVNSQMAELIQQMMAKKPDDRPESMEKILEQLKLVRVYRPGQSPPKPEISAEEGEDANRD